MNNRIRDNIWLWGQTPGSHHASGVYKLPGVNRMTPEEGLAFFGIKNLCRVKTGVDSALSFEDELNAAGNAQKIVLSVVGAGGCAFQAAGQNDLTEIIDLAGKDSRIIAGIMDDFVSPVRMEQYTPEVLEQMRNTLRTSLDRVIELWSVIYERDFDQPIESRLQKFDLITYWTWYGDKLADLDENYQTIRRLAGGKRMMMGVYLWDYGNACALDDKLMRYQLDFVYDKMKSREIEGIVLCSNCCADLGLRAAEITKQWIEAKGDDRIGSPV